MLIDFPRLTAACLALMLGACASAPAPVPAPPPETVSVAPAPEEPRSNKYERQLQQAMVAAHPRSGDMARARTLLETLLAATDDEARPLHTYARTLQEQLAERQRLDGVNARLAQQLERSGAQLKDSQQRADDLQRKIDALTEIERSPLPARIPSRGLPR